MVSVDVKHHAYLLTYNIPNVLTPPLTNPYPRCQTLGLRIFFGSSQAPLVTAQRFLLCWCQVCLVAISQG